jgi:hypothetical protein
MTASKPVSFKAEIQRYNKMGEKTGWTYVEIPVSVVQQLSPAQKKSFRVKGKLDAFPIKLVSLIPVGKGNFILPFNAEMRKGTGKKVGDIVLLQLQPDNDEIKINDELLLCLDDEPVARDYFFTLTKSHRNYFSKWIDSAKTTETKAKRIAQTINALERKMNYAEMVREGKE